MEFLNVDSLEIAREKLLMCAKDWLPVSEVVASSLSLGRILSEDIFACDDIPHFRRSIVDGFAVVSANTAAAMENAPVSLVVKGSVGMGQRASFSIVSGECAEIFTGSMIPDGADAAVMVEFSEMVGDDNVLLYKGVSFGENVVQVGEDIKSGELLLSRGRLILPQDIGVLAAAGVSEVSVYTPVRLTIISTGDELVSLENTPELGQIRDINTYALSALSQKSGFDVVHAAVLPDDLDILKKAVHSGMIDSDVVIISGGSSKGKMDLTRAVFEIVSEPGVFTHGLALKPGKPTILGFDNPSKTVLVGLPGHPAAAMLVFELLLVYLLRKLSGSPGSLPIPAKVSCNIASAAGRQSCGLTKLVWVDGHYLAEPIFGKSGIISAMSKADGYFLVNREKEGLVAGETVLVHLL